MNAYLFSRLLEAEAKNLYQHNMTPENFMDKIIPILATLEHEYRAEKMSANDLEEILVSSKPKKEQQDSANFYFYDVVDLSMYRAN